MTVNSKGKKEEYWNHFKDTIFRKLNKCPSLTDKRMEKLKPIIWNDERFWGDILLRHGGNRMTPEEMKDRNIEWYEHCMGNFSGMLIQTLIRENMVKIK